MTDWLIDKSAAVRTQEPGVAAAFAELAGHLHVCPAGALEQLYSARSADDYDAMRAGLDDGFGIVSAPSDILDRALMLQHDLAHHHGMWHRTPIPDLLIAETALHHGFGVVHIDGDFDRISEVRPLISRRLR